MSYNHEEHFALLANLGETVGWMRLISINGPDSTHQNETLQKYRGRQIADGRSRCAAWISVIKRVKCCPLDRDPTVQMSSARFNQDRYNPS